MSSRARKSGRASYSAFVGIPVDVMRSEAWKSLPAWMRALYVDMRRQFNGYNNGDISAADAILGEFQWSHSSIQKGVKTLMAHQLIEKVRQGGIGSMNRICSLYAFTDAAVASIPAKGIQAAPASLGYRSYRAPRRAVRKRTVSPAVRERYARRSKKPEGQGVNVKGQRLNLVRVTA